MNAFEPRGADLTGDVAYRLMAESFVRMFWRPALLDQTVGWLVEHGYQVERMDASSWSKEDDFHRAAAETFGFSSYYGRNLDAFNDFFGEGIASDTAGFVLVFSAYDTFTTHCPHAAYSILDVVALHARRAALRGSRMLCLVQSNDPALYFDSVGATPVLWNGDEWSDFHRL